MFLKHFLGKWVSNTKHPRCRSKTSKIIRKCWVSYTKLVCRQDMCCVCRQDICCVCSQDICCVSRQEICSLPRHPLLIVYTGDVCADCNLLSAGTTDVLPADTTDVLSADTTDVLSADILASVLGGTGPKWFWAITCNIWPRLEC